MASGLLQNLTRQSVMYHGECTYWGRFYR